MKKFCLMFLLLSLKANAGVFYPIMNMSNVNSEMCVAANIKIGDKISSANGSQTYAVVKSISGESNRCQQPNNSNRTLANVEFIIGASPNFTIDVPDEFKAIKKSDILSFHGLALALVSDKDGRALLIYLRQRETKIPPESIMQATVAGVNSTFKEQGIIKNQALK